MIPLNGPNSYDQERIALEKLLSNFASVLLRKKGCALYQAYTRRFEPQKCWIYFKANRSKEFALYINGFFPIPNKISYYLALCKLTATMRAFNVEALGIKDIELIESFTNATPLMQTTYKIYDDDSNILGQLAFAETTADILNIGQDTISSREDVTRMISQNGNGLGQVHINLSLGGIQIPVEDFLKLRPGMEIRFGKPNPFIASLEVNGKEWCQASVQIEDGQVVLEIGEITIFAPKTTAEATSGHSYR